MAGFHLLQDLAEIVAFGRLQRRELFVRRQMPQPQLLADGQHIPIVQEGGCRSAERTTEARSGLLINADGVLALPLCCCRPI